MRRLNQFKIKALHTQTANHLLYLAQDLEYEIPVLLKLIENTSEDAPLVQRLKQECNFTQRFFSRESRETLKAEPEYFYEDSKAILVLPYIEGHGIKTWIKQTPRAEDRLKAFTKIALDILNNLETLHRQKYLHLDVTPNNIIYNQKSNQYQLIDFENVLSFKVAATLMREDEQKIELLQTLDYTSPEQTGRLAASLDARSDIYSLGCSFYEILTGHPPFKNLNAEGPIDPLELIHHHLATPAPLASVQEPAIPEILALILQKCMAKEPQARYQTLFGLKGDLLKFQALLESQRLTDQFELGSEDRSTQIRFPRTWIGPNSFRQDFLNTLKTKLEKDAVFIRLCGTEGAGKSRFLKDLFETQLRVLNHQVAIGQFKASQQETIPYGAIQEAFEKWTAWLFTRGGFEIEQTENLLRQAIGMNLTWAYQFAPALESLLGTAPKETGVPPTEAQARIHETFRSLLKCLSHAGSPFLLVLEDWQWADELSQNLLENLITASHFPHFCLIVTERDQELPKSHLWNHLDSKLLSSFTLPAMSQEDVKVFVSETLGERSAAFAETFYQKSMANPGTLKKLIWELSFDEGLQIHPSQGWILDLSALTRLKISSNQALFLKDKLKDLSASHRKILQFCTLLEGQAGAELIQTLMPGYPTRSLIRDLISEGFLQTSSDQSHFELTVEALKKDILTSLDSKTQQEMSSQAANLLRDTWNHQDVSKALAIWHLLRPLPRIPRDLEQIFIEAGLICASSHKSYLLFKKAKEILDICRPLLDAWGDLPFQESTLFEKHQTMSLEVNIYSGHFQDAQIAFQNFIDKIKDRDKRVPIYKLNIIKLSTQSHFKECIQFTSKVVKEFGILVPPNRGRFEFIRTIIQLKFRTRPQRLQSLLDQPLIEDQAILTGLDLIATAAYSLYNYDRQLCIIWFNKIVGYSFKYGFYHELPVLLGGFSIIFSFVFKDFKTARLLYETAQKCLTKLSREEFNPDAFTGLLAGSNVFWDMPERIQEISEKNMERFYRIGKKYELVNTWVRYLPHALTSFISPKHFLNERFQEYVNSLKEAHQSSEFYAKCGLQFVHLLTLPQPNPVFESHYFKHEQAVSEYGKFENTIAHAYFKVYESAYHLLMGHWEIGYATYEDYLNFNELTRNSAAEIFLQSVAGFGFGEILLLNRIPNRFSHFTPYLAEPKNIRRFQKLLDKILCQFKTLHLKARPELYASRYWLIQGVKNAVSRKAFESEFAKGLQIAIDQKQGLIIGQGYKLLALAHLTQGQDVIANLFFMEAIQAYERWGAPSAAESVRINYQIKTKPVLIQTPVSGSTTLVLSHSLDLQSILKASMSLAGEVKLETLLKNLLNIVLENAGAQECTIFLKKQGQWTFGGYACHENDNKMNHIQETCRNQPLQELSEFSKKAIDYSIRTKKSLLIGDVSTSSQFPDPEFPLKPQMKSLLCMPIENKGQITAVLYLENRNLPEAFSKDRVDLLKLLGGQMAISIDNAMLYQDMEAKIIERTQDVRLLLDHVQQGIFSFERDGKILGGYSKQLETILRQKNLEHKSFEAVLFEGSPFQTQVDAYSQMRTALQIAFGESSFQFQLNRDAFPRTIERHNQILDLEWVPIEDTQGNVQKVMVTLRDVTELRAAEAKAKAQAEELNRIGQILAIPRAHFESFLKEARAQLQEVHTILMASQDTLSLEAIQAIFRNLHTLKGNVRTYHFDDIASAIHHAEEVYSVYQKQKTQNIPNDLSARLLDLQQVTSKIDLYETFYREKIAGDPTRNLDAQALLEVFQALSKEEILKYLKEKTLTPITALIQPILNSLPNLAQMVEKPIPQFNCFGIQTLIHPQYCGILEGVFVHLFRNAMDHGLPKDHCGKIVLEAKSIPSGVELFFYDNGPGLNLTRLAEKDPHRTSDEALAALIFESGVSTASQVSELSGRGVGMDAVKYQIEKIGGQIQIVFRGPRENGKRPFGLQILLPHQVALSR